MFFFKYQMEKLHIVDKHSNKNYDCPFIPKEGKEV